MEWINTKDQLPKHGDWALVYVPPDYITLAEYWSHEHSSGWLDLTSDGVHGWDAGEIEWWMPLPEPPEENTRIVTAEIPGPGARVDDHTIMAEDAKLDLSARPTITRGGFQELPIGKVLDIWQDGKRVFMKARISEDAPLPSGAGVEFYPGFIVKEMRIIDGVRIINAVDLMGISMGFRYTPQSRLGHLWAQIWHILRQFGQRLRLWASGLLSRVMTYRERRDA